MTTLLAKYEAACLALAEAHRVDEVKDIHDKAVALRAYAIQAKNADLEAMAAEVRLRAERRLGELLVAEKAVGRFGRGRRKSVQSTDLPVLTLEDLDIDQNLSRRAQKVASISERAFEAAVAGVRDRIKAGKGATLNIAAVDKKERRDNKEKVLAGIIQALPKAKFGVILADPEWRFEPWSRKTGMDRAADNHYPTSATEVISARDVPSIAADDCVLFLWATAPMLPHALCVMEAWGFDYRSHFIWAKDRIGAGYWNRNKHELLLIGVKGKPPAPAMGTQWESLIAAPVGKHSAKPERFLELIEHYFPNLPKIELNRRGPPRTGWSAWGNEAEPGTYDSETGEITEPDAPCPPPETSVEPAPPPASGAGSPILASSAEDLEVPEFLKRGWDNRAPFMRAN